MSLTDFISNSDVRDRVTEHFPNQGERAERDIKAQWQTRNYLLVGTAFDYLARFWLRRNVDTFHARPWVAETSLDLAEEHFPEVVDDVRDAIERAKDARDDYLGTGTASRDLVESSLDLARIDGIYRGGQPPSDLGSYDEGDIVDLLKLLEALDECEEIEGDEVHLNPTFGLASGFVGGADADAILDNTFIDLKTTGKATFKVDYWRQLVGYLVLADAHKMLHETGVYDQLGVANEPDIRRLPSIDEFGVYFCRHGELITIPAEVVYEADGYREFRSWFIERALEEYRPFDEDVQRPILRLFEYEG